MSIRLIVISLCVLIMGGGTWAQQDPFGVPDTVRLGSAQVQPYSSFSIPIYLYNDEPLMGITIPLAITPDAENLTVDSVVFNLDRFANCQYLNALIDTTSASILLGIIPSLDSTVLFLEPGQELLADIYISYGSLPGGSIDTVVSRDLLPFNALKFVGENITPFEPSFVVGIIELEPTAVLQDDEMKNNHFDFDAFPNPFNSELNIAFVLPSRSLYRLTIYNILGQKVIEQASYGHEGVNRLAELFPSGLSSGIYLISLEINNVIYTRKATLMK